MFFDVNAQEKTNQFSPVEPGTYNCTVLDCVHKNDANGEGTAWHVTLTVDGPIEHPASNKRIFVRFTWDNPSEMAQKIGRSQFADFVVAAQFGNIVDKEEFIRDVVGRPVIAQVVHKPNKNKPGDVFVQVDNWWNSKTQESRSNKKGPPAITTDSPVVRNEGQRDKDVPF